MPLEVVYLDDEVDLVEMFADNFASAEILVKGFSDPQEALEYLNANTPDLIFLDYRLPNTNGDLIAQAIKFEVPKVLVTGDLEIKTVTKFERIFSKPFKWNEMEEFLKLQIKKKSTI